MKIKFTKQGAEACTQLNELYGNENSILFDCWGNVMKDQFQLECLILDAGMFVDECYADNEFSSLEEFARNIAEEELNMPIEEGTENVLKRLNLMIEYKIIELDVN